MRALTVLDVVIDTNILVAAFRSSLGASYKLLQTLEQRRWRPVISPALALEYESVLKRAVGESGLGAPDIDDFLEDLCSRAGSCRSIFGGGPCSPTPMMIVFWK
jgi:predicted nucleic acid-binding protein